MSPEVWHVIFSMTAWRTRHVKSLIDIERREQCVMIRDFGTALGNN
jgi:hypothetical protein